jgi:hypothetical protein
MTATRGGAKEDISVRSQVMSFQLDVNDSKVDNFKGDPRLLSPQDYTEVLSFARTALKTDRPEVYGQLDTARPDLWIRLDKAEAEYFQRVVKGRSQVRKNEQGYDEILSQVRKVLSENDDRRLPFDDLEPKNNSWNVRCLAWCMFVSFREDGYQEVRLHPAVIMALAKSIRDNTDQDSMDIDPDSSDAVPAMTYDEQHEEDNTGISLQVTADSAAITSRSPSTIAEASHAHEARPKSGVMLNTAMLKEDPQEAWVVAVSGSFRRDFSQSFRGQRPTNADRRAMDFVHQLLNNPSGNNWKDPFSAIAVHKSDSKVIKRMAFAIGWGGIILPDFPYELWKDQVVPRAIERIRDEWPSWGPSTATK